MKDGPLPSFFTAPSTWSAAPAKPKEKSLGNLKGVEDPRVSNGSGVGLTSSALDIGVGETVVVKGGAVMLKSAQRDDQAILPYFTVESVGEGTLAQVVVIWFVTNEERT